MKINEILSESQLDELSAMDVARGVGSAIGKTAQAVGAGIGAAKGAWDAGKAGYQGGKNFVSGQRVGRSAPSSNYTTSAPVDALDSMTDQDLSSMKAKIDGLISARSQPKPVVNTSPKVAPIRQVATTAQVAPTSTPQPVAVTQPTMSVSKGTKARGADGQTYTWQGAAWVNDTNNRLANKALAASLSQGSDNRIKMPKAAE